MSFDPKAILEALRSTAQGTGVFQEVITHEPVSAPQLGDAITVAFICGRISTASSGLASVSVRWEIVGRIFVNGLARDRETLDEIDPRITLAAITLFNALVGDYQLGGLLRHIDILGAEGEPMEANPGYIEQDKKIFRTMDLRIPLIINDAWDEVA